MTKFTARNNRSAKLTPMDVMEIRRRAETESQSSLCREFQVSLTQIGRIVRGESWQSMPAAPPSETEARASQQRLMGMLNIEEPRLVKTLEEIEREEARVKGESSGLSRLQQEVEKLPESKAETKLDDFLGDSK